MPTRGKGTDALHVKQQVAHHIEDDDDDRRSPENETFGFLRARLREVDLLVSQEPKAFAPRLMPMKKVGYIPVGIYQLDGLNKLLHDWDIAFYGRELNAIRRSAGNPVLDYPHRRYFLHLVQLLPNEGTIRLLDNFKAFHHRCRTEIPNASVPRLLICHYTSANNPNTRQVQASLLAAIQSLPEVDHRIWIIRLRPSVLLWNSLVSHALAVVQLRDYEGIPEMLLGAVQKQKSVIVSREFTYYSFVQESDSAISLKCDEVNSHFQYLLDLVESVDGESQTVKEEGKQRLEDSATTVANDLTWFSLASTLSRGSKVEPSGEDISMAEQKD